MYIYSLVSCISVIPVNRALEYFFLFQYNSIQPPMVQFTVTQDPIHDLDTGESSSQRLSMDGIVNSDGDRAHTNHKKRVTRAKGKPQVPGTQTRLGIHAMAKLFGSAVPSFFESGAKHTSHSQVETLPGRGLKVPCGILGGRCYLALP